jgi:hypothetical protein
MTFFWYNPFTKTIEPFKAADDSDLPGTPQEAIDKALTEYTKDRQRLCNEFDQLTEHINALTRLKADTND